jgi:hypothetical protein
MSARRGVALAVLVMAAGCAHSGPVPATTLRGGAQCGGAAAEPSARWLASEAELRQALAAEGPLGAQVALPAGVDFARDGVVLVAMGRRATAGYGVGLESEQVQVKGGVATLVVRFDEPPPGAIMAQVITSPCLLVALPREGLREVRVVDAAGAVRAVAPVGR